MDRKICGRACNRPHNFLCGDAVAAVDLANPPQTKKPATLPVLKGSDRMPNAYIELIDSLILQRQALKISQRELASAAGVSWTEVALMEQKKHMVQLRALLRITAALNCKLVAVSVE